MMAAGWWTLGTSAMIWLRDGDLITWGQLVVCLFVGLLGPGLLLVAGGA